MIGAVVDDLREAEAQRGMEDRAVVLPRHPLDVIADRSSVKLASASSSTRLVQSRKKARYQPSELTKCRNVSRIEPYVPGAGTAGS